MRDINETMMKTAELWAEMSYCIRAKVGAVIAKDGRIVSTGFNGTLNGLKNECEDIVGTEKCPDCNGTGTFETAGVMIDDCPRCGGVGEINILKTKKSVVHAEANAILFAAKNGLSTKGCDIYLTLNPCVECAKMIYQSGINHLYYRTFYPSAQEGLDLLKDKIKITHLK